MALNAKTFRSSLSEHKETIDSLIKKNESPTIKRNELLLANSALLLRAASSDSFCFINESILSLCSLKEDLNIVAFRAIFLVRIKISIPNVRSFDPLSQ